MSVILEINNVDYPYPEPGDVAWGEDATAWAQAVTSGMLQKAGGLFQLLDEVDFGPNYGLKSIVYKTRSANIASAGQFRLARTDVISFRNEANDANLDLSVDASNQLLFNGNPIGTVVSVTDTDSIDLTLTGTDLTADLNISAAAADTGYINADSTVETDGLQVQVPILVGDSGSGGSAGVVPAPSTGDATKFLQGDGTWAVPAGTTYTFDDTDSIDLTDTAGTITADILLSSDPADTNYQLVDLSIETDGLKAQIADTDIIAAIPNASSSVTGLLTSTDWSTFNSKQAAGSYITALTGDVTASGPGSVAATIANSAVTLAKMANLAANSIIGNNTGSPAAPIALTTAQTTAMLDAMVGDSGSGGTKGLVPAPASGDAAANKFLKADGTWAAAGSALTFDDTDSIDLTDTSGTITADINLSADTADTGYTLTDLSIETDGLKAQTPEMVGDSGSGGSSGTVPAPGIGDDVNFLRGDGTWAAVAELPTLGPEQSIVRVLDSVAVFDVDYDNMTKVRSGKDSDGIFTIIEWYDDSSNLRKRSTLSGGTPPEYTLRTVDFYDTDGATLLSSLVYDIAYDIDGDFEEEVLQ
jgi:hypothetical protein